MASQNIVANSTNISINVGNSYTAQNPSGFVVETQNFASSVVSGIQNTFSYIGDVYSPQSIFDAGKFYGEKIGDFLDGDGGISETLDTLPDSKRVTVSTYGNGIVQVDPTLNWMNPAHPTQLAYDALNIIAGHNTANDRWRSELEPTTEAIANVLENGNKAVFTSGVNVSGLPEESLVKLFSSLDIPEGTTLRVGHSFGDQPTLLSGGYDNGGKFILFSQRISSSESKNIMDQEGIKPEQVLTINCAGDFPHQPNWGKLFDVNTYLSDICTGGLSSIYSNLPGAFIENIGSFWDTAYHGYEDVPGSGYHLFIDSDGDKFNDNIHSFGKNHGVIDLATSNEIIWGHIATPSGEIIKINGKNINDVINSFLRNAVEKDFG